MIEGLLPIGSVVVLGGSNKKIMIYGIKQTHEEKDGQIKHYDYVGVIYPEGYMGRQTREFFDKEDIETVSFVGYSDIEREGFVDDLRRMLNRKRKQKEKAT